MGEVGYAVRKEWGLEGSKGLCTWWRSPMFRVGLLKVSLAHTQEQQYTDQSVSVICSHRMSNFSAGMHQIQFRLGCIPEPAGRAYSAPPYPLAGEEGLAAPPQEPHFRCRPFRLRPWLCSSENSFFKSPGMPVEKKSNRM